MKRFMALATLGLAVLSFGTGCSHKTSAERDSLLQQNRDLTEQVAALKARADAADARAGASATSALTAPTDAAPSIPDMEPAAGGGRSTELTPGLSRGHNAMGEDVLRVSSDVLFDSGKATIKPAAKKALDTAVAVLRKEYSGRQIRVEGYTDPVPVKKTAWDDNWDLGAARARAVMLYLETKGVKDMYIASFGSTKQKSTKNMAENRRVEIVVVRGGK